LQTEGLTLGQTVKLYESIKHFTEEQRLKFEDFENLGKALCGEDVQYTQTVSQRVRRQRFADGVVENNQVSARDKFRQNYYIIVDHLLNALDQRSKVYNELYRKFGFLSELCSMSETNIQQAAGTLVKN
jgi:negative regulator of sigma E activity